MHNSTESNGLSDAFDLKYLSSDLKINISENRKKKYTVQQMKQIYVRVSLQGAIKGELKR